MTNDLGVSLLQKAAADRRAFLKGLGIASAGLAAVGLTGCGDYVTKAGANPPPSTDTAQQIFTAALIAEGLAITFYYNGLTSNGVIQDANLAGPGGTATNVPPTGHADNVAYFRAALQQEIDHATLLRTLIGGTSPAGDPVQQFYFPANTFSNLATFSSTLDALESAFIGAYMTAGQELSLMAANIAPYSSMQVDSQSHAYTPTQLIGFAKVAASILGVESEHRTLGRTVNGDIPANNLSYESTDGLTSVYNGSGSAVTALSPFVTAGAAGFSPTAYSYATASANAGSVTLPSSGNPPS